MHSIFYYSHELARYDFGPDHPFKPERVQKAYELCNRYGVLNHPHMTIKSPPLLDKGKLLLAHSEEYLDVLERTSKGELFEGMLQFGIGTEDNPPLRGIYEWSRRCAGATWEGMTSLLNGDTDILDPHGIRYLPSPIRGRIG